MIVNGDLATMVAVIEFEILSLVGRKIDLIYLYGTRDFPSPPFSLSLSLFLIQFIINSGGRFSR